MITIDYKDSRSINEQICQGIQSLIVGGILSEDEQLPSVRELSLRLTVNPNTVQKAYRELENQGYIYSIKGKGCFVAPVSHTRDERKISELYLSLSESAKALRYLGESLEDIIVKIKEAAQ